MGGRFLSADAIRTKLSSLQEIIYVEGREIEYDEDSDGCHPRDFRDGFEVCEDLYFVPKSYLTILNVAGKKWPACIKPADYEEAPDSYKNAFLCAVRSVWGSGFDESTEDRVVGEVDGQEITREVIVLSRSSA
jgi:hypothetical protein